MYSFGESLLLSSALGRVGIFTRDRIASLLGLLFIGVYVCNSFIPQFVGSSSLDT